MSMSIGTRIRELRKKNHLTQLELSSLLYVTDKTVSSWESDRTEPSLETLIQLSEVLDSSVSYLLYGDIEKLDIETEVKIKLTEQESSLLIMTFFPFILMLSLITCLGVFFS